MNSEKLKVFLHIPVVSKVWKSLKTLKKYMRKGITAIRAIAFYIHWTIIDKKKTYDSLKGEGIDSIVPYKPLRWKNGVCYFIGEIREKKVFIKSGGFLNTVNREVSALSYSISHSDYLKNHTPTLFESDSFVIEEMLEGESLSNYHNSENESIINQLFEIYNAMKRINVLHLDIRPDNFIVDKNGTVILIDFGFALVNTFDLYQGINNTNLSKSIIKNLGSRYSPHNGTLDDAYSMLLTMKYICPSLLKLYPAVWQEMNVDIGTRIIKL